MIHILVTGRHRTSSETHSSPRIGDIGDFKILNILEKSVDFSHILREDVIDNHTRPLAKRILFYEELNGEVVVYKKLKMQVRSKNNNNQ